MLSKKVCRNLLCLAAFLLAAHPGEAKAGANPVVDALVANAEATASAYVSAHRATCEAYTDSMVPVLEALGAAGFGGPRMLLSESAISVIEFNRDAYQAAISQLITNYTNLLNVYGADQASLRAVRNLGFASADMGEDASRCRRDIRRAGNDDD